MSHYLEANDSVRSAWALCEQQREEAYLQAWTETLFALAFGRDVVVPASYAVDSFAFQRVLADVSAAYDEVTRLDPGSWFRRPRPVRLHLHTSSSFGEAAAGLLERALTSSDDRLAPPFHSSLYPDLRERISNDERLVDQLRSDGETCDLADAYGDDERGELFRTVWRWSRGAAPGASLRVVQPRPVPGVSLQSYVDGLLAADLDAELETLSPPDADVAHRTLEGLRTLSAHARTDAPFNGRSRLRQGWQWSTDGRSAEEILGQDVAELVREVVDTLYNRVVVSSIGDVTASFSTAVAAGSRVGELYLSQGLAVDAPSTLTPIQPTAGSGREPTTSPATLDLSIDASDAAARHAATAGLDRSAAVRTLVTVLAAQTRPEWAASATRMADAQRSGNAERLSDAVAHHSRLLSELLGDVWNHETGRQGLRVRLSRLSGVKAAATAGGAAVASNSLSLVASASPAWLLTMAGLSAAGGVVAAGAMQRRSAQRHRSHFRGAMAEIVTISGGGR
ncbi:MAG TPA: hypothetical protein VFL94_05280 [Actinomycetales bacterium]|nr:hypothetical protein [Actinomycetales bacterium]